MDPEQSWNKEDQPTSYESTQLSPKQLRRLISLLREQRNGKITGIFSFKYDHQLQSFQKKYDKEISEDVEVDEPKAVKKRQNTTVAEMDRKKSNIIMFDSILKTRIFMKVYEKQLAKISGQFNVEILENGKQIWITQSTSQLLRDQIMNMYRNLKIFQSFDKRLWQKIKYSQLLRLNLQKMGIFCHYRNIKPVISFYSTVQKEQDIKKCVLKQTAYELKIFDLRDRQLSDKYNSVIFKLLVFSVVDIVKEIRELYETDLEINNQECSFILHNKHEVFAKAPLEHIQKHFYNLRFISFQLTNSRKASNILRSKQFEDFKVMSVERRLFMCIDRRKLKSKEKVLEIFHLFLEELSKSSNITIHLVANNAISKTNNQVEELLKEAFKYKLHVNNYSGVRNKENNNMVVKIKDYSQKLKMRKRLQFTNFLKSILILNEKEKEFTEEEINRSMVKDNTQINNSLNVDNIANSEIHENNDNILNKSILANQKEEKKQFYIDHLLINVEQFAGDVPLKKGQKDSGLQQKINSEMEEKFKIWNVKINNLTEEKLEKCNKDKGYLAKNIIVDGKWNSPPTVLLPKNVEIGQEVYLIYFDENREEYIVSHMLKRLS